MHAFYLDGLSSSFSCLLNTMQTLLDPGHGQQLFRDSWTGLTAKIHGLAMLG